MNQKKFLFFKLFDFLGWACFLRVVFQIIIKIFFHGGLFFGGGKFPIFFQTFFLPLGVLPILFKSFFPNVLVMVSKIKTGVFFFILFSPFFLYNEALGRGGGTQGILI